MDTQKHNIKTNSLEELSNKILNNRTYKELMQRMSVMEKDRIFCLHGIEHSLDVARIGYILILENGLDISKELIYAAALLHDIGRVYEYEGESSHHIKGAVVAEQILSDCDCDKQDIALICDAIRCHKLVEKEETDLRYILYRADKLSRNCYACAAYDECYWDADMKNNSITI